MNLQEFKKNILTTLKDLSENNFTKEDCDKYISFYEKQNPLLKTGPEYYYIPEGDVVVKSSAIYDLMNEIIEATVKDMIEDKTLERIC